MNIDQALKILELHATLSLEDLKKQYRLLSLQWHPDRNKSPGAEKVMAEINDARDIVEKYIAVRDRPAPIPQRVIVGSPQYYGTMSTTANLTNWTFSTS